MISVTYLKTFDRNLAKSVFEDCMKKFMHAYPTSTKRNETTIKIYFESLKDIPSKEFQLLVDQWVKTESKFPSIADIRKLYETSMKTPSAPKTINKKYSSCCASPDCLHGLARYIHIQTKRIGLFLCPNDCNASKILSRRGFYVKAPEGYKPEMDYYFNYDQRLYQKLNQARQFGKQIEEKMKTAKTHDERLQIQDSFFDWLGKNLKPKTF